MPGQAPADDGQAQDVGNIVHLEHINLGVTDLEQARIFYSEGLGLTVDPGLPATARGGYHVIWYNIGRQQFHIVKGQPNVVRGRFCIDIPNMQLLHTRLQEVSKSGMLEGTQFEFHFGPADTQSTVAEDMAGGEPPWQAGEHASGALSGTASAMHVVCPWGNRFLVRDSLAPDAGQLAPQLRPFLTRSMGVSSIELLCAPGDAAVIGRWYEGKMQALVRYPAAGVAAVQMGSDCTVAFVEDPTVEDAAALFDGWHICLYVANYAPLVQAIQQADLIDNDHPFADKCYSLDDALSNRQFRCKSIVGSAGKVHYQMGHEVRSLHHPRFMAPLYNRLLTNC